MCRPTYYLPEGETECKPCPISHYCPGGVSHPQQPAIPCEDGTYSGEGAAASADDCGCEKGRYKPEGSETCKLCELGTRCPGGNNLFPCERGTYQSQVGQDVCAACPPGKSTDAPGATLQSNCETCPETVVCTGGSAPQNCSDDRQHQLLAYSPAGTSTFDGCVCKVWACPPLTAHAPTH